MWKITFPTILPDREIQSRIVGVGLLHFPLLLQLKTETLLSHLAVIFLVFYNNLFYTQLAFVFYPLKDFYSVRCDILAFCFFLLHIRKDFDTIHEHIDIFCFSFLQKDFDSFRKPLFEAFLCFTDNVR